MPDDHLVTIKTFTYPHEVALIRGYLEAESVECFVKDELMVQTYGLYSNALGGIKLQVREKDSVRAWQILKDGGFLTDQDIKGEEPTKIEKIISKILQSKK